ncbi:MAG: anthranilate phosphoribosyltransferase [Myxococcales bacterium]|nr:anthranilate phosphoribosyltransferase [Myxococcales bacterium]
MSLAEAIKQAVEFRDLPPALMDEAMETIFRGDAHEAQIAALAVALRMKGESPEELAAAARVMKRHAKKVPLGEGPILDTCGTGGDGLSTFNISTVSALVVAATGVRVAKHGNRAVSSTTGSADVLEALGVSLELDADEAKRCMEQAGIVFLFAPLFHGALRHAAPVRRALGIRTFFNLLGPLANPAPVSHQLVGVYDGARVRQFAEVLRALGLTAAWAVHGEGGFDEVSPLGVTKVARLRGGEIDEFEITPGDFGLEPVDLESLRGGDPARNAAIARAILAGESGPPRTAVLLNAAAALAVVHDIPLRDAAARAAEAIDSGAASGLLERFIQASHGR